ncbi:hypothetical protein [Mycolicibacterium wolinskyi]|uniref:hypothetical protein n=1 Tax=Mycolicibacterium wolinskyi TaxID=59750 RepID=UPI0039178B91
MKRPTMHKRTARRVLAAIASGWVLAATGSLYLSEARADDIIIINPGPRPALDLRIPLPLSGWCPGGGAGSGYGGYCEGVDFADGTRLNYFRVGAFWQGPRCIRVDGTPTPPEAPHGCGGLG